MRTLAFAVLAAVALLLPSLADAAELQMYRRAGCPYCEAWDREVGPIYGKTAIGRAIPLRMVDVYGQRPQVTLKQRIIYTPTFVLIDNGAEVGRIQGYPGDAFFWSLLEQLVQKLNLPRQEGKSRSSSVVDPAWMEAR